jgi:hypothetical protein
MQSPARLNGPPVFGRHVVEHLSDQTHERLGERWLLLHGGFLSIPPSRVEAALWLSFARVAHQFSQVLKGQFHVYENALTPCLLVHVAHQVGLVHPMAFKEPVPLFLNADTVITKNNRPLSVCLVDKPAVFFVSSLNEIVREENSVRLSSVACLTRRDLIEFVVASTASSRH